MKIGIVGPICRDLKILGTEQTEQTGGVTYYTGEALHSLGVETTVFGSYSSQDMPYSKDFGFSLIHIGAEGTIKFSNIQTNPNDPDRRVQEAYAPNNRITTNDIPIDKLQKLDYVIFGPLVHDNISALTIQEMARRVKDNGTKLVLASQGMFRYLEGKSIEKRNPENLCKALSYVDYVFFDDEELKFVSEKTDIKEGVNLLRDTYGATNVIVTQGSDGSKYFTGRSCYTFDAFKTASIVDTVGAGDSYMAGFLKAQELSEDPYYWMKFASMTATMSIERKGAFDGSLENVLGRIEIAA